MISQHDVSRALESRISGLAGDLVTATEGARSAVVCLDVPAWGLRVGAAAGEARPGVAMTVETPFHVASIGKLFTATLVMQLVEAGRFDAAGIDITLAETGLVDRVLLDRLHVRDGIPRGAGLTLRQLLTHTSGLADAFNDDAAATQARHGRTAPGGLGARLARSLAARARGTVPDPAKGPDLLDKHWIAWDPARPDDRWAGMLNYYLAELGSSPAALPGEQFHYSDSAYVLLGHLIERATDKPYHEVQKERILDPLGLGSTWMHDREPARGAQAEADVWLGGTGILGLGGNLSFDWGGGGQVATVDDLLGFFDALLAGRLFRQSGTLAAMKQWLRPAGMSPPRQAVGLGLQQWRSPAGAAMTGHAGAWGAHLWRDERTGATVAGTLNTPTGNDWALRLLDEVHAAMASF